LNVSFKQQRSVNFITFRFLVLSIGRGGECGDGGVMGRRVERGEERGRVMTRVHLGRDCYTLLVSRCLSLQRYARSTYCGYVDDARRISGLQRELHSSNNSRVAYKNKYR